MGTAARTLVFVVSFAFLQFQKATLAALTYQTVALSGQAAPGTFGDTRFAGFNCVPRIDDAGNIVFAADLIGSVDDSNMHGIWLGPRGNLKLLARDGDAAPGSPGPFESVGCEQFANAGSSVIAGFAYDPVISDQRAGLWLANTNVINLLAANGAEPPGLPDGAYDHPLPAGISSSGVVTFVSRVATNSGTSTGIWTATPGSIDLAAVDGMSPPGGNEPFFITGGRANDKGELILKGYLASGNGAQGVWLKSNAGIERIALIGEPLAGLAADAAVSGFSVPRISDDGTISFAGSFQGNNVAIWAGRPGALHLLALKGAQAPDSAPGTLIGEVLRDPTLNRAGGVAFTASLAFGGQFSGDMGLWAGPPSAPKLILDTLTPVISTPRGELNVRSFITPPAMNSNGDVALFAQLQGPGVTGSNARALWVRARDGTLFLIAREGEPFDLGGGEVRTIRSILRSSEGVDQTIGDSYFNDAGQLVFVLTFTDNSAGVFVATVPEPMIPIPIVTLACALSRRRRPSDRRAGGPL